MNCIGNRGCLGNQMVLEAGLVLEIGATSGNELHRKPDRINES